ncbi:hypothetical protein FOL47_000832 [Perkinsus chesapeaki]|uniref:Uncharacterized protein n=1 Tax=Perkinsus chesapeaki TaxID=330153 RepID=A0A7J6MMK8_PERCH|nr:hypothetical protein FOL47_000832 [Perkinsus chesapeaki]
MVVNTLVLSFISLIGCQAVFPPNEQYCSKEATSAGAMWALKFPRDSEPPLKDTMSIFHVAGSQQVFTWGIPMQKNTSGDKTFVQVDTSSEHFTKFAKEYGLAADLWEQIPFDTKSNSMTIQPNSSSKQFKLQPDFCFKRTRRAF